MRSFSTKLQADSLQSTRNEPATGIIIEGHLSMAASDNKTVLKSVRK